MLKSLPTTQILVSIGAVEASPQIGGLLPFCEFFDWLTSPESHADNENYARIETTNRIPI